MSLFGDDFSRGGEFRPTTIRFEGTVPGSGAPRVGARDDELCDVAIEGARRGLPFDADEDLRSVEPERPAYRG